MQEELEALPADENELAGHSTHVDSAVAAIPLEYFPPSQRLHGAEPATALNLPATQDEHVCPSGPEEPALQMQ
jgi:hypothetical protein